jgi:hypothetical protein
VSSFAFLKMTFPIGYFYVVQRPNDEFASQFHRNLCIDGGYEICAEMYNKNILAPLSTFVPKVCLCDFTRAPKPHCPNDLSVYSYWAVQLTLGFFFSTSRFHRFWRNISTHPKRRPRMHRRWYTNSPKMSLPFCGVSRESTVARAAHERASSADPRA